MRLLKAVMVNFDCQLDGITLQLRAHLWGLHKGLQEGWAEWRRGISWEINTPKRLVYSSIERPSERAALLIYIYFLLMNDLFLLLLLFLLISFADFRLLQPLLFSPVNQTLTTSLASPKSSAFSCHGWNIWLFRLSSSSQGFRYSRM